MADAEMLQVVEPASMGKGDSVPSGAIDMGSQLPRELVDPYGVLNKPGILPGWDGAPFRGNSIPSVKEDDPYHKQPQMGTQAHLDILYLHDAKDRKRYQEIMQMIANGFGQMGREEVADDPKNNSWRVMIRWWEVFSHMPKER